MYKQDCVIVLIVLMAHLVFYVPGCSKHTAVHDSICTLTPQFVVVKTGEASYAV